MEKVYWCNTCQQPAKGKKCERCGAETIEAEVPDTLNLVETE